MVLFYIWAVNTVIQRFNLHFKVLGGLRHKRVNHVIDKLVFDRKSTRILSQRCIHKPAKNLLMDLTIFAKESI